MWKQSSKYGVAKVRAGCQFVIIIHERPESERSWRYPGNPTLGQSLPVSSWSGPSCSKLTTSLVNDSLKFTSSDTHICWNFRLKKLTYFQQNISEYCILILFFVVFFFFFVCLFFKKKNFSNLETWLRLTLEHITKTRLFKYIENFTSKNWKVSNKNSDIFSYICSKHRLWVLVRTASPKRF